MILKPITRINGMLRLLCRYGLITIIPTMTIIVFIQVILRYGFNNALSWVEEAARYMLVWASCLGAVYASDQGKHVSITLINSKLKGNGLIAGLIIANSLVLLFFLTAAWQGWLYTKMGAIQKSASLRISMIYIYGAIPISFLMMFSMRVERFVIELKNAIGQGDRK